MVKTTIRNPREGIYPATPDYVHAIEVERADRTLYVSGTMGLDEESCAGNSLEEQLELVWSNLRAILNSADMTVDNIVRVTSYLRDPVSAEANQNARVAALNGRVVPTTTIAVTTLSADWLIEIEIIAVA